MMRLSSGGVQHSRGARTLGVDRSTVHRPIERQRDEATAGLAEATASLPHAG